MGVIQVIDNKGLLNLSYAHTPDNPFYDTVKQFAKMLSSVLVVVTS